MSSTSNPKGVPPAREFPRAFRSERWRNRKQGVVYFSRRLGRMVEAGASLLRGLRDMKAHEPDSGMRALENELIHAIEQDHTFSEACQGHPEIFDSFYVAMVRAAELDGSLESTLVQLASIQQEANKTQRRITGAMIYPLAAILLAALLVLALMLQTWPWFHALCYNVVIVHFFLAASFGIVLFVAACFFVRSMYGQRLIDRGSLHLPLFGPLIAKALLGRFFRAWAVLLAKGVPVLPSLTALKDSIGNVVMSEAIGGLRECIKEGESMLGFLEGTGVFPDAMFVSGASQANSLPDLLLTLAGDIESDLAEALDWFENGLSPVLVVLIAILAACSLVIILRSG